MHYIYIHNKIYTSRNTKTIYNLERKEYIASSGPRVLSSSDRWTTHKLGSGRAPNRDALIPVMDNGAERHMAVKRRSE